MRFSTLLLAAVAAVSVSAAPSPDNGLALEGDAGAIHDAWIPVEVEAPAKKVTKTHTTTHVMTKDVFTKADKTRTEYTKADKTRTEYTKTSKTKSTKTKTDKTKTPKTKTNKTHHKTHTHTMSAEPVFHRKRRAMPMAQPDILEV